MILRDMSQKILKHFPMPQITHSQRLFYSHVFAEDFHSDMNNEVIHIIEGRIKLTFESGLEFSGGKNDTLFIPHGVSHRDIFESSKVLEAFHIVFSWDLADQLFAEAKPNCVKYLPEHAQNEIKLLFDMIRTDNRPINSMLASARLMHLLGLVWTHVFNQTEPEHEKDSFSHLTNYAKDYICANFSQNISIEDVAKHLRVSRSTLIRAFKKSSDLSFGSFLLAVRMKHAPVLLREKSLNLADCAARCGFSDPSYFSKVFKKYFGFSPKNCH